MHVFAALALDKTGALDLAQWVPAGPLISLVIIFLALIATNFQPKLRESVEFGAFCGWISVAGIATAGFLATLLWLGFFHGDFREIFEKGETIQRVYPWLTHHLGMWKVDLGIVLDPLSITTLFMVGWVASMIQIFSIGYMKGEAHFPRYFAYHSLFVAGMLILVLANNFLSLLIGWELMGLCSYLLIGFYFKKPSANAAQLKAFMTTRLADMFMILGIALVMGLTMQATATGTRGIDAATQPMANGQMPPMQFVTWRDVSDISFNFEEIHDRIANTLEANPASNPLQLKYYGALMIAAFLIFVGTMGKSAQFPLHIWLPDAMEGPTPVSALIHAATMVAAGVYLIARTYFIFDPLNVSVSPALLALAVIGGFTAFWAATIGLAQYDIKRVLAFSTLSQLGYMVAGMGVGAYAAGAFHLVTHAYFKALLFLGSGAVILACHHNQDMRYMGALRKYLTFTKVTYFIGYLALIGTPFLFAGAYSKDAIIAGALDRAVGEGQWLYSLVFVFLLLGAFLTPFYMTRQMVMIFSGDKYRGDENPDAHGHGAPAAHGHDDHAEDHAAHAVADVLEAHGHDGHHEVAVDVHGHEAAAHEAHGHEDHHGGTPHEQPLIIYGPLVVLAIFTMTIGWLYSPHGAFLTNTSYRSMNPGSFGGAASVFSNSFYPKSWEHAEHEEAGAAGHEEAAPEVGMIKQSGAITPAAPHQWHVMVEFLVFILATAGAAMGYGVWGYKQPWVLGMTKDAFKVTPFGDWLFRLLNNKYYIDEFYGAYLITPFLLFTHLCRAFDTFVMDGIVNAAGRFWLGLTWLARWVDQLVVDGLVNGAAWAVQGSSRSIRFLQSGFVQNYFMVVVVSILVWLAYARSWNYHTTANAGQTSPEAALGSMGVPPETPPPGTTAPVAEAAPATPVVTPAATPAVAPVPAGATH